MTTFSEFSERHDVGAEWSVRFTADEPRAREMAAQYRRSGYDVRVLPMSSDGEELDVEAFDAEPVDNNPIREIDGDACTTCLGPETYVLLTRAADDDTADDLVYD